MSLIRKALCGGIIEPNRAVLGRFSVSGMRKRCNTLVGTGRPRAVFKTNRSSAALSGMISVHADRAVPGMHGRV